MISAERLERYKDFVDPERTGAPYDPRQGLEKLMGVLSPDPKGIVLAAMGYDWYGTKDQLQSRVFSWLEELDLPSSIWPLSRGANWQYIKYVNNDSRYIIDGSLVELGAVVKKAEDPSQVLYSRSIAGVELAVPLVQQAVRFVSRAREFEPHKFDSMWRIVGSVASRNDHRRPIAVFDTIDFLVHNPGKHRGMDLQNGIHISPSILRKSLTALGNCGIVDYIAPSTEKEGQRGRGWVVYTLVNPHSAVDLDPEKTYQDMMRRIAYRRTSFAKVINHIKEHPYDEYEHGILAKQLNIRPKDIGEILSALADLNILDRPDPGFKSGEVHSIASANALTHLFYDLVCEPAKEVADTLSSLLLRPWDRKELAVYLENYNEERSQNGAQGGEDVRKLLLERLPQDREGMKLSYIVDLYNDQTGRGLKTASFMRHLKILLESGRVEQPKPGYYRLA